MEINQASKLLAFSQIMKVLSTQEGFTTFVLNCIVLYCIYFGPRNLEDIGQVNVQQYKPQNN
jgi:hypothetical protein